MPLDIWYIKCVYNSVLLQKSMLLITEEQHCCNVSKENCDLENICERRNRAADLNDSYKFVFFVFMTAFEYNFKIGVIHVFRDICEFKILERLPLYSAYKGDHKIK